VRTKNDSFRNKELGQIHMAKAKLGLDDETYRSMLWTVARVRSSADLDHAGRRRVIEHLKSRGWESSKPTSKKPNEWSFIDSAPENKRPLLKKILMLCRDLEAGKSYAEGVAKRQCGFDRRLEMMTANELWLVVGALERTKLHKELGR
jgi:hypothetical protein